MVHKRKEVDDVAGNVCVAPPPPVSYPSPWTSLSLTFYPSRVWIPAWPAPRPKALNLLLAMSSHALRTLVT
jgi:hypothetical protein